MNIYKSKNAEKPLFYYLDLFIKPARIDMDNDPILAPLMNAFTEIEHKNLRVDKIILEKSKYFELITSRKYLMSAIDYTPDRPHNFRLWGASVIPNTENEESKVYSEDGFISSCSVKVEFKSFRFKNYYIIVRSRADIIINAPKNELRAIDTLREMITETEYRKYMVHSFITVPTTSGKIYQIFRNDNHVRIWQGGILIEELCIYIKDSKIPPTDKVITLKIMIETDEEGTRKLGNIYNMRIAA